MSKETQAAEQGEKSLKVIAADSGAATLNDRFEPLQVVAACAVVVEPPYDKASSALAESIFADAESGYTLVIHELELCLELLKTVKADVVHLDMSLGSACVEELSAIDLSQMHISSKARANLLKILPKIRKMALEVRRTYGIEVLAIGKESIPVRIAELSCGAHAIIYSAERVVKEERTLLLGLPSTCRTKTTENGVMLESLMPAEYDLAGYAKD
jgi:hypothetical protein